MLIKGTIIEVGDLLVAMSDKTQKYTVDKIYIYNGHETLDLSLGPFGTFKGETSFDWVGEIIKKDKVINWKKRLTEELKWHYLMVLLEK